MLNAIPIFGWILDLMVKASLAVPFYFVWNGLAPIYLPMLPERYLDLPFWHIVGIFIVVPILKLVFVPTFVHVTQTNKAE